MITDKMQFQIEIIKKYTHEHTKKYISIELHSNTMVLNVPYLKP